MPIDRKQIADAQRILGHPDIYPPELLSWMLKKLSDNPYFQVSSVQLPTAERPHYVGQPGEAAFNSSWVQYNAGVEQLGYRKDPNGTVYVSGTVKKAASTAYGEVITTLPVGYRPGAHKIFACYGQFGAIVPTVIRVDIAVTGNIVYVDAPGVPNPSNPCHFLAIEGTFQAYT